MMVGVVSSARARGDRGVDQELAARTVNFRLLLS